MAGADTSRSLNMDSLIEPMSSRFRERPLLKKRQSMIRGRYPKSASGLHTKHLQTNALNKVGSDYGRQLM